MIIKFQGDYSWLSNFSQCSIILDGIEYPSVEHAYIFRCVSKSSNQRNVI
jgi:predicted NAD-dependent protein-ADP-ribosyltransferase YbiA (DUF1768 family)